MLSVVILYHRTSELISYTTSLQLTTYTTTFFLALCMPGTELCIVGDIRWSFSFSPSLQLCNLVCASTCLPSLPSLHLFCLFIFLLFIPHTYTHKLPSFGFYWIPENASSSETDLQSDFCCCCLSITMVSSPVPLVFRVFTHVFDLGKIYPVIIKFPTSRLSIRSTSLEKCFI